jgi:hypothetical protein
MAAGASWARCVAAVKKNSSALNPYAHRSRATNPRKLGKAEERAQLRRLLDWSAAALRQPDADLPNGKRLHAMAREQVTMVRQRLRAKKTRDRNPRGFVVSTLYGDETVYYDGDRAFKARAHAKVYPSSRDAASVAWLVIQAFPKLLRRRAVKVLPA